jgi:hypothetical protein
MNFGFDGPYHRFPSFPCHFMRGGPFIPSMNGGGLLPFALPQFSKPFKPPRNGGFSILHTSFSAISSSSFSGNPANKMSELLLQAAAMLSSRFRPFFYKHKGFRLYFCIFA